MVKKSPEIDRAYSNVTAEEFRSPNKSPLFMEYQRLDLFRLPSGSRGKSRWFVQLWWIVEALFFRTSPQLLYGWRRFLLRCFGAKIGTNVVIRASVHTHFPWKLKIGDYSWIGDGVVLYSLADINIGKNVVISQKSYLCAGSHDYRYVEFPTTNSPITIEDECWLATDVFVAPGITVGRGTVVGARSSVFKSLPPGKICAGSPAVCFRDRETLT